MRIYSVKAAAARPCQVGVVVIPAVVFDRDQARNGHFFPPVITDPTMTEQGPAVDDAPRFAAGDHKTGGMKLRLCGWSNLFAEILQDPKKAALQAVTRILEVSHIEVATIIKGQDHRP